MINIEEQLEFFKVIGKELDKKIICYVMGGSAMMFYGAKASTKDVDLVFLHKEDLQKIVEALERIGFSVKENLIKIFKRYKEAENKPVMMIRKDVRFDLFVNEIITFKMSDKIINRVKETHEFDNLIIKVISPEDLILLKSATEREKDKYDALSLIEKFNINWDFIIQESINQTKLESYLFPVFLFDFLYELKEDLKADIPKDVLDKIRKIGEEMMIKRLHGKEV